MLITDNFDSDTSSEWSLYNNAGARSVVNNQLVYDNNTAIRGMLLSPYVLNNNFVLSVDMRLLTDYSGQQRGGLWLLNSTKTQAMQFYFEDDHCGSVYANVSNGTVTEFYQWQNTTTNPQFNSGKVFNVLLEKTDNTIKYYIDGVLMRTMNAIDNINSFALFALNSKVAFDNLSINQIALAVFGSSKQDDGIAISIS